VALQDPAYVGVASMVVQGRPGFVRTPYVSDRDVARICAATAGLARDLLELLSELVRPEVAPSGSGDDAPAWGGDRNAGAAGASGQDAEDAA
jgi:hypothetical protein